MDDKNQNVAVENAEEKTTSPTNSPPVEAPTTEEQTTTEQADQSVQEESTDVTEAKPKDPRDYQVERLAEENRRLKADKRQGSAFDAFRPQVQPNQGVDVEQFKDPYGEINWNAYQQAVTSHAQQAANATAQQTVQELIDENNARNKYPDLFADPDVEQEIADRWVAAKLRGENVSVSDVAERIAKRNSKDVSKAEKRGAEKMLQEVTEKEQAGLSASSQTSQGSRAAESQENLEYLSDQTRQGNEDAIVERLKTIPWANK